MKATLIELVHFKYLNMPFNTFAQIEHGQLHVVVSLNRKQAILLDANGSKIDLVHIERRESLAVLSLSHKVFREKPALYTVFTQIKSGCFTSC